MALSRVKTWAAGDVLTANDLNNEFNNVVDNAFTEPFVASEQVDLNGQLLLLDADGDTLLDASTNNTVDLTIAGADDFRWTANTFTLLSGSNQTVQSGDITITQGRVLYAKGVSIASSSTVTVPTDANTFDITGVTTITAFSTTQAGYMFYARFTGAGLNLTYNATSMLTPWARDYRTVPNEVLCFWSLGSGNYIFWSLNGPKERVGVTIEGNTSSAPAGYLDEDGTAVSRTTYAGLFQEISTTYGTGDGSTTFNVPDTRGRVTINVDGSANRITSASTNGTNADTLGGVGGAESHTLAVSEVPGLTFIVNDQAGGASTADFSVVANGPITTANQANVRTITTSGGGGAHSNTQPWMAKRKFIRF